ncbi:succinate dehydrogenase assembly factor 2 [Marinobacter nanhaiticus D15-8W]|uniref:FAD assembly factor SdhE n=1 Tax=Marinobacter nanhaiticus D15-8W TaxID=626887 RepID=N6W8X2_9GAMM|nr:succinate dehydrogenase assembly factor 2 [Marinobacter nanhaiticus]ENO16689.1 succinate dehydrogenase assembly factor 2 family protein [Marinobacter nanhaiticus D15-8W]BES72491.1 succinate dehydrogenase assembly factor 2 [Marinobacter nanhaiticus D15-8W]
MQHDVEYKRLYWHSRRGMLELDVLLIPFLEEVYPSLPDDDKARYRKLIDCEDTEIYQWFMQRERPQDENLQVIVDMILKRVQPD